MDGGKKKNKRSLVHSFDTIFALRDGKARLILHQNVDDLDFLTAKFHCTERDHDHAYDNALKVLLEHWTGFQAQP